MRVSDQGEQISVGNGEIHIPGPHGVTFVAPTLIYHYVKAHQYVPPADFINSVIAVGSREY